MAKKKYANKTTIEYFLGKLREKFANKTDTATSLESIEVEVPKKGEIKTVNGTLMPDVDGNIQLTVASIGALDKETGIPTVSVGLETLHLGRKSGKIKNWVQYSISADGSIYNGGLGYKTGYRVRSGGAEAVAAAGICTGFIPLKIGDTLRIYPLFSGMNANNTINFFDESFTNLGQINDSGSAYGICVLNGVANPDYKTSVINGINTLTLSEKHSSDIRYVRITHYYDSANSNNSKTKVNKDVSNFIITVNEEFEVPA